MAGVWLILADLIWAWLQALIWDHICSTCHSSSLGQDYLRHILFMAKGKNVKGQVQPCKLISCPGVMTICQSKTQTKLKLKGKGSLLHYYEAMTWMWMTNNSSYHILSLLFSFHSHKSRTVDYYQDTCNSTNSAEM